MKSIDISIRIECIDMVELNRDELSTIEAAKAAAFRSYAPYSQFHVGAGVLLDNREIISGNNQENAAYPSGLCAERTAIFYANSLYPDSKIKILAIAARDDNGFLVHPVPPCGACRQVMIEAEQRFQSDIEILLYGTDRIYRIKSARDLLPLSFSLSPNR